MSKTKKLIEKKNLSVELITAKTPIKERLEILKKHEVGDLECLISYEIISCFDPKFIINRVIVCFNCNISIFF